MKAVSVTVLKEPVIYLTFPDAGARHAWYHRASDVLVLIESGVVLPMRPNGRPEPQFDRYATFDFVPLACRTAVVDGESCAGHKDDTDLQRLAKTVR